MQKQADTLLNIIRNTECCQYEDYGFMISYGDILQNAKLYSHDLNPDVFENLLRILEKENEIEIVAEHGSPDFILGVRLK